jgi:hypothetical protein
MENNGVTVQYYIETLNVRDLEDAGLDLPKFLLFSKT